MNKNIDYEVIIVGAGLSGLSAAKWLIEAGLSVIVIEAENRVGGRLFTKHDSKVGYVDLGGSYVGPTQDHILRMAKELGVETYRIKEDQDILYYKNGRRIRQSDSHFRNKNPLVDLDLNNLIRLMEKLNEQIPADCPWNSALAEELDTITCDEFLRKNCWTKEALNYVINMLQLIPGAEPYQISALNLLWMLKQCGGFKRFMSTDNGAQERKFIGGSQQICEKLASIINESRNSKVIINSPVVKINQEKQEYVTVKTLDGGEFKALHVILACPPIIQMKIHFQPSLPPLRQHLMQRLPNGPIAKCMIYYETAFWKERGLCGTIFIDGGEDHPICGVIDDTKPDGSFPALVGFLTSDNCLRHLNLTNDERKQILARSLAEATGYSEFLHPIHYEEKNWMSEEYTGLGGVFSPGVLTQYGRALRTPIDRIYFAGTESAIAWSGFMTGAVEAGERAAREVLCSMGKITEDKIWIKEPESQYCKARPFPTSFEEKYMPSVGGLLTFVTIAFIVAILSFIINLFN